MKNLAQKKITTILGFCILPIDCGDVSVQFFNSFSINEVEQNLNLLV